MEKLQLLIKDLNKSEKKMARNFLTNYGNTGKKDTVSLDLFKLLDHRTKTISNKEASIILFGKDEKNRIRVLKNRMKNKIFDAITTEIVLENQQYDNSIKLSIQLKKKLGQYQNLYYSKKGSIAYVIQILNEVIHKATQMELYIILMEAINQKKLLVGFREGIASFEQYERDEKKAMEAYQAITTIINSYYKLLLLYRNGTTGKKKLLTFFKPTIAEGNQLVKKTKSKVAEYFLNVIKYAYYDEIGDYNEANKNLLKQIKLVSNNKAVYRIGRLGATYDYLCQTNIRLKKYTDAIAYTREAKKCFEIGSLNFTVAQELEFRSLLYNNQTNEAGKVIRKMCTEYKDAFDKHRRSTHQYFLACFHFSNGQFKKCNQLLSLPFEFKNDKTGWEFNSRVLGMMASIEQGKIESSYEKHHSLTRYFNRNKAEKKLLSSRNKIILELIAQWLKYGGNRSIAKMKGSELIEKLSLPKNKWDPLGAELNPFHKWIKSKI